MTVADAATAHTKKLMKLFISLLRRGFSSSKCKTAAKMAVARIKLLRNKREVVVRQMRRDIALLLESGQDATARIRVEHVTREQNVLAANELIELFCELVVARLSIIAKQRECPADLKEGIASLIFAAPRCSEIPELLALKDIFEKKYGRDFVSAATDLRPNCGVNRLLIDKLSVRTPPGEVKLKVMKEIAKEYQVEWDTTESEKELLKPPEELIEGPNNFVSASNLPIKPSTTTQFMETKKPTFRSTGGAAQDGNVQFEDSKSAAEAAAESAMKAIAAAEAAAYMAKKEEATQRSIYDDKLNNSRINSALFQSNNGLAMDHQVKTPETMHKSRSLPRSDHINGEDKMPTDMHSEQVYRRYSYNPTSAHSDIKFDESDYDEETEMEEEPHGDLPPPNRPPPPVPSAPDGNAVSRVHPKLPDYDELAARFEALKFKKSQF
ncbi:IST1-like protein [Neltuma alba]|uniref:IST1-like protein n=1 Tax=Neltuma alba TaxID=207710 RepID=UPI0010A4D793|nr:IST1-like protein [Prosopis alba]